MTWEELLGNSAALLNDASQSEYTNAVLLPYLNIALLELEEVFELNNVPVTNETSAVIPVNAGVSVVGFATSPALPLALKEIQRVWCSNRGQDSWVYVDKRDFLTESILSNNTRVGYLAVWAWINQQVRFLPANVDLDIKIDYIHSLFTALTLGDLDEDNNVINSDSALQYRVAGLVAEFIMENTERAGSLNANAELAINRSLGISTKGRQSIMTRRRPFRSSWKSRGVIV